MHIENGENGATDPGLSKSKASLWFGTADSHVTAFGDAAVSIRLSGRILFRRQPEMRAYIP
jgi:hypothetical protein